MARLGRRSPAGLYVFASSSLAYQQVSATGDIASGVTGTAYQPTVKVGVATTAITAAVVANAPTASAKALNSAIIAAVQTFDPVTGSFRSPIADRAFVQTDTNDPVARVGPVAGLASASAAAFNAKTVTNAGIANVTATVYTPSSFRIVFSAETTSTTIDAYNATVSFLRRGSAGPVEPPATAYDANKINITLSGGLPNAAVAVAYDIPNQAVTAGSFASTAQTATAYSPSAKIKALPTEADVEADVFIGIFSPRPADIVATAYNVQGYVDTVDWRTYDIDADVRTKVIDSESRTFVVAKRQSETIAR